MVSPGPWSLAFNIVSDGSNVGIGTQMPLARLDVSNSGASQCCAPDTPTLSLSELSNRAWLQFHNAGEAEAYMRLSGGGVPGSGREGLRRIEIGDSQEAGTNLQLNNGSLFLPQGTGTDVPRLSTNENPDFLFVVGVGDGFPDRQIALWDDVLVQDDLNVVGNIGTSGNLNVAGSIGTSGSLNVAGSISTSEHVLAQQNNTIQVGEAFLSSGGPGLAHLANNEWHNGAGWVTNGTPGALIQLLGQATNFYTHDGAGNHTVTMNISPIGDVTIAGKLLDNNLKMVDTGEFTNKFMFYKRFSNLGDNIQFPTRISPSDFQCGIAGLNTTTGDIEENGSGAIIQVPTYVARVTQPSHPDFGEDRWHIQGEFRTHNTGDNWTITLLCVSTELADWFGENDLIPGP